MGYSTVLNSFIIILLRRRRCLIIHAGYWNIILIFWNFLHGVQSRLPQHGLCVCAMVLSFPARYFFRPVTSSNVSQPPRRIIDNESAINSKKRMSTKPPNYSFQFPFFCNTKSFFLLLCRTDFYNRYKTKQEMMIFQVSFFMFLFYIFVGGKKNIQTNIFIAVSCAVVVLWPFRI